MAAARRGGEERGGGRGMCDLSSEENQVPLKRAPRRISRPPLKKMKRPTSSSRRESALGKAKGEEGGVKGE